MVKKLKLHYYFTFILSLLLLPNNHLFAQPILEWKETYGGSLDEQVRSIQQTMDGGFIVIGFTKSNDFDVSDNNGESDIWILKLDSFGNIEWKKSYGGSSFDDGYSIQQTTDGGFVVSGRSFSDDFDVSGNNGESDIWILKLDNVGNLEWEKNFGGSLSEEAHSIQQTIDGGFIIAAQSFSDDFDVSGNNGESDIWILKLKNSGSLEWEKTFGSSSWDYASSIQQTTDGGFILTGQSSANDFDVSGNYGEGDIWILKLDNVGNLEWEKNFGGSLNEESRSIQQTADGGFVIAGYSFSNDFDVSNNNGLNDIWILKLDKAGNLEWEKNYGGSLFDEGYSIQQTTDGGFVVAGAAFSDNFDVGDNNGLSDIWVLKLDNSGNLEWEKNYGGSSFDYPQSIQLTTDGGFIIAGHTQSNDFDVSGNNGESDIWILKFEALPVSVQLAPSVNRVSIFPNPSGGSITIRNVESMTPMKIKIVDLNGKLIRSYNEVNDQIILNKLPTGQYILEVISGVSFFSKRIIIY